jgi:quercetin dioxygenase-like cupin family protein
MADGSIYRFDEIEWHVPNTAGLDPAMAEESAKKGAGRKFLAQGDSGYFAQVTKMPPNLAAPAHSHDYPEVFMVLSGSCTLMGEQMHERDMTVVPANQVYSFTTGPDGLEFLVVRTGKARWDGAA